MGIGVRNGLRRQVGRLAHRLAGTEGPSAVRGAQRAQGTRPKSSCYNFPVVSWDHTAGKGQTSCCIVPGVWKVQGDSGSGDSGVGWLRSVLLKLGRKNNERLRVTPERGKQTRCLERVTRRTTQVRGFNPSSEMELGVSGGQGWPESAGQSTREESRAQRSPQAFRGVLVSA